MSKNIQNNRKKNTLPCDENSWDLFSFIYEIFTYIVIKDIPTFSYDIHIYIAIFEIYIEYYPAK